MTKTLIQELDELAHTQPGALEAALEDLVNSGFADLESQLPPMPFPTPTPGPAQSFLGWW